jgi:hypothetical protein
MGWKTKVGCARGGEKEREGGSRTRAADRGQQATREKEASADWENGPERSGLHGKRKGERVGPAEKKRPDRVLKFLIFLFCFLG